MFENVEVLTHSSIRITAEKTVYFDPFKVAQEYHDADVIFITHDHYDHFSPEDICKIMKPDTLIVAPRRMQDRLAEIKLPKDNKISVVPGQKYEIAGLTVETVSSYNNTKHFHPKENEWVGYVVTLGGLRYYVAGDTDENEENRSVKCDVALVPIGGTYTMDAAEAAVFVNDIKPKTAIPTHYGSIVGKMEDAADFAERVNDGIQVILKIK